MGFHVCEYCGNATSSGDVTLKFTNGRSYEMPDMITHYVEVHQYLPPSDFVESVMNSQLAAFRRVQTRSIPQRPVPVGYLSGEFPQGDIPSGFLEKLKSLMEEAAQAGYRLQTKGLTRA